MIYADNAATTKPSRAAIEAMLPYMEECWGNPSSTYDFGQKAAAALFLAREDVAACFNARPKEIYFTSGGTESDNQAIISAARIGEAKGKKHIVSTAFEHHAVLNTLKKLEARGFDVELLDVHENGMVTPQQVEAAIREDTCLVSVMYANNEIGSIMPIQQIGRICRRENILFHTDAVQAAGHIPIDVEADNIDMLSISAHKFNGPKGVGALYARQTAVLSSLIEGGPQERGRRAGTENVPAIVGMAAALKESCNNMEETALRVSKMRDRLIRELRKIPHSVLNGDERNRLPGNVNFCFEGVEGETMLLLLDERGICASSGSACASGFLDPSHVLTAIGRGHELARGSLRLTLSSDNTEEQIDQIISSVKAVVESLREISPSWEEKLAGKKSFLI